METGPMSHRGFSLATGMFAITLLAADLAAYRELPWPALDFAPLHLRLSLLPMLNVLAVLGYRLLRVPRARHPFAVGLFAFGLLAMLAHAACVSLDPERLKPTYIVPIGPACRFCRAYRVPHYVLRTAEGYSYFRYYPALVLVNYLVPQLIAAGLGGIGCVLAIQRVRRRVPHTDGTSPPVQ
jgi:hypothetical protein